MTQQDNGQAGAHNREILIACPHYCITFQWNDAGVSTLGAHSYNSNVTYSHDVEMKVNFNERAGNRSTSSFHSFVFFTFQIIVTTTSLPPTLTYPFVHTDTLMTF